MTADTMEKPRMTRRPNGKLEFRTLTDISRGPACYIEMGQKTGTPLLFLHGFGGDLLTWQFCLGAFAAKYRVIALDLPGHGRSTMDVADGSLSQMVDWLDEVLTALELDEVDLVGHSMGGKIGIALALSRPSRVRSLSLISPAGLGGFFDLALLQQFLGRDTASVAEEIAARLLGPASTGLIPSLARSLAVTAQTPAQRASFERLLGSAGTIGQAIDGAVPWDRVACPLHIIWGADDTILPLPESWRLPPDAPFHALAGIGHLPRIEAPGQVITLLNGFFS